MNKFDYYCHLRSLEIEESVAISMVAQTAKDSRFEYPRASAALIGFSPWEGTAQGWAFWHGLYLEARRAAETEEAAK